MQAGTRSQYTPFDPFVYIRTSGLPQSLTASKCDGTDSIAVSAVHTKVPLFTRATHAPMAQASRAMPSAPSQ